MTEQSSRGGGHALFDGMLPEQRAELESLFERRSVRAGTVLFEEGDAADRLYLVESGEVWIVKSELGVRLDSVGPGEEFGAMAALGGGRRSARAVAGRDSVLLSLSVEALERLSAEQSRSAYGSLLRRVYAVQSEQLRRQNESSVDGLRLQLHQERMRTGLARFLTHMIAVLCVYGFVLRVGLHGHDARGAGVTPLSVALLLAFVAVQMRLVLKSGYPLESYGLTLRDAGRHALEAIPWTLGFMGGATLLKWLLLLVVPAWRAQPLFALPGFAGHDLATSLLVLAGSVALVPAQEFVGRGTIQGSLEQLLPPPRVSLKANLISNLMISTIQLHQSPVAALLAFFPGLLWGYLFSRQRSLVGVSLSHAVIGAYLGFCVGLPGATA